MSRRSSVRPGLRALLRGALLVSLTAACSSDPSAPEDATKDGAKPATTCEQDAGPALQRSLEQLCSLEGAVAGAATPRAPEGVSVRPPSPALPIELRASGWTLAGAAIEPDALGASWSRELDRVTSMSKMTGRTPPSGWALIVDGDVPAGEVKRALDQLATIGAVTGELRLAAPLDTPLPGPPDPSYHDELTRELAGKSTTERAAQLAGHVEAFSSQCPALVNVFRSIASAAPDQRCPRLASGVAKAVIACGCPDWTSRLHTLLRVMTLGADAGADRSVALPVQLDTAPSEQPAPETRWSDVVERLSPGTQWPLHLHPR